MKEERMRILKMLEDGKITAEDAVKLLEAVQATARFDQNIPEGPTFEERIKEFSRNAEAFAKDVSGKMGALYKDMEPKLKKATKTVVEKTAGVVDEISKALNESLRNLEKEKEDEGCCCTESNDNAEDINKECECSECDETDVPLDNDGNPIE